MIQIIVRRKLLLKQGRSRNTRISPNLVTQEPTLADAHAWLAGVRGDYDHPGLPLIGADFYDLDAWNAAVRAGKPFPTPLFTTEFQQEAA